jgi:prepilin-type processing-associated H-X9-DG protein
MNYADDDVNWLYPTYLPVLKAFSCPSTKNEVRNTTAPIRGGMLDPKYTYNQSGITSYADRIHGSSVYVPDLVTNAGGKNGGFGSSYEVTGYLNSVLFGGALNPTPPGYGKRKTDKSCATYAYGTGTYMSSAAVSGQTCGASDIWIIYDADDDVPGDPTRKNDNYPDLGDNHGNAGGNVAFCDGHAQWVAQKNYFLSFERGTDEWHPPIIP